MNNIRFYVNMNDDVLRCEYHEKIDGYKFNLIELPNTILRKKLADFLKKYDEPEVKEDGDISIVTFYDVDVSEMDRLIKRSNKYIKEYNQKAKEEFLNKQKEAEKIKVTRKNKFRKMFIRTSASLLVTLVAYASSKDIIKNINYQNDQSINTEDMALDNDKNYENSIFLDNSNVFIDDTNNNSNGNEDMENNNYQEVEIPSILPPLYDMDNELTNDNSIVEYDQTFYLNADNWIDTDKFYVANAYYSETITKMANRYGIDPALALAIGIHERGLHSEYVDAGGAIGLFQIQVEGIWNWNNKEITAYNFDKQAYETVTITRESVSDVFENIKVGCMMIQDLLIRNNYNIAKAVTEYNYGVNNLNTVINTCSLNTGFRQDEFNDINNLEWLNYRNIIHGGDPEYLENVFKYIPDGSILKFTKPNGENISFLYTNTRNMSNHRL